MTIASTSTATPNPTPKRQFDYVFSAEDEGGEHDDHNGGCGGDDPSGGGEPTADGAGVVSGADPVFVHAGHEEDLVVHG